MRRFGVTLCKLRATCGSKCGCLRVTATFANSMLNLERFVRSRNVYKFELATRGKLQHENL